MKTSAFVLTNGCSQPLRNKEFIDYATLIKWSLAAL
jgi:hypothetical protein